MTSIADSLWEATALLREGGVAEARREAGSLLAFVIGRNRTFLISHAGDPVDEHDLVRFREAVARRAAGEPLQYITGVQDFFGREFRVTTDTLIPRPETELLVEAALEVMGEASSICDVGTGSGCIAVTLLCERTDARAIAVDISETALAVAAENARRHGVSDRIVFQVSDCFENVNSTFDLIVSNPPYVSADALPGLQREVKDHEPLVALSPGEDGLSIIRRLLDDGSAYLKKSGYLIMEIGFDQCEKVQEIIDPTVWHLLEIRPDLQGIPRIVVLSCHKS